VLADAHTCFPKSASKCLPMKQMRLSLSA